MEKIAYDDESFKITSGNELLVEISSDIVDQIVIYYKQLLDTLDNIIDGNCQCSHCGEWFSKEKISKGELPVKINGKVGYPRDIETWLNFHDNEHVACQYDCDHVGKRTPFIYNWAMKTIIRSKNAVQTAKALVRALDDLNLFLKKNITKKREYHRDHLIRNWDPNDFVILSDYGSLLLESSPH